MDGKFNATKGTGEPKCANQCGKNTKLSRGSKECGLRIGKQWAKVGHGSHSKENQQWENRHVTDAHFVESVEEAPWLGDARVGNVGKDTTKADWQKQ